MAIAAVASLPAVTSPIETAVLPDTPMSPLTSTLFEEYVGFEFQPVMSFSFRPGTFSAEALQPNGTSYSFYFGHFNYVGQ